MKEIMLIKKKRVKIHALLVGTLFTVSTITVCHPLSVFAQQPVTAAGSATSIPITDKAAKDGSLIGFKDGKYYLTSTPYDQNVFGVISDNPSVSFVDTTLENARLVVSAGKAYILLSTKNGKIKVGDSITTSSIKGVGEKATQPGFIVGAAVEPYSGNGVGKVLVELHPGFGKNTAPNVKENLLTAIQLGAAAASLSPLSALRYILSAGIAIASFVLGFIFFGRISGRGVEAVGRNPLASGKILTTVVLNVILTVVIIAAGVAISYLILVL